MIDMVVIGAGGFGRETLDVLESVNQANEGHGFRVIGVVDDSPSDENLMRLSRRGYRHLGTISDWKSSGVGDAYLIAVGSPSKRSIIAQCLVGLPSAPPVIHPRAMVGSLCDVGSGTVICAGVQVSTNVKLGDHVHVNPSVTIGHDVTVANFVSINPGAIISGEVTLNDETLIGAGAVILQGLTVGAQVTVGASACVVEGVPDGVVAKGIPARWLS
ncbi:MAG: NeuD/PglB/VioB family sugar acetyltransferase [Propionibacteriaceae bacterium]|nr:NeuD/PglB/VioB family sugar acetyltransferase [Propionibacteriaceae bacterium]